MKSCAQCGVARCGFVELGPEEPVRLRATALLRRVSEHAVRTAPPPDPNLFARLLWALGKARFAVEAVGGLPVFLHLARYMRGRDGGDAMVLQRLSPRAIADISWAYVRLGLADDEVHSAGQKLRVPNATTHCHSLTTHPADSPLL